MDELAQLTRLFEESLQSTVPAADARLLNTTLFPPEGVNVDVPVAVRLVNAPVDGVVAPMAVELIPVAVVFRLPAVMVRLFPPAEMLEADNPDKAKAPEVAVRFSAPVVWVSPLLAVSVPAAVTVPLPLVEMFPGVDRVPFSLMVKVLAPPDWMASAVLVAPLVSLITKAVPVPALVRASEVWVDSPDPRVKSMFLPSVVVMVLPAL
jgi:hypothetical protein